MFYGKESLTQPAERPACKLRFTSELGAKGSGRWRARDFSPAVFNSRVGIGRRIPSQQASPSGASASHKCMNHGGNVMRLATSAILVGIFCAAPLSAQDLQPPGALSVVVSKVIARENAEMNTIRQRSPIVETYVQKVRVTESDGSWLPDGDHYFIGRAELSKGLDLESLAPRNDSPLRQAVANLARVFDFGSEFLPQGFLQMIYVDVNGLDTQNYNFDYVRREFLGEVRTLVFDVTPSRKNLFDDTLLSSRN